MALLTFSITLQNVTSPTQHVDHYEHHSATEEGVQTYHLNANGTTGTGISAYTAAGFPASFSDYPAIVHDTGGGTSAGDASPQSVPLTVTVDEATLIAKTTNPNGSRFDMRVFCNIGYDGYRADGTFYGTTLFYRGYFDYFASASPTPVVLAAAFACANTLSASPWVIVPLSAAFACANTLAALAVLIPPPETGCPCDWTPGVLPCAGWTGRSGVAGAWSAGVPVVRAWTRKKCC